MDYNIVDAMRNDFRAQYPHYSEEQIIAMVMAERFQGFMVNGNTYSEGIIPGNIEIAYGMDRNTHLIPEYAAYRDRGDAFLRHQWNYLASLMPYTLPPNLNYDYFRNRFKDDYTEWARWTGDPKTSMLYWINFDAASHARARLAALPEQDRRYSYLSLDDEARLNRVFSQIDPYFTPVNTRLSFDRLWQQKMDNQR